MKLGYLNSVLKTSLLATLFGIGAFSANGAGHLPMTYEVEGENYSRTIEQEITEIGPGLMQIEARNTVVFTFSKTREDFPTELSGTCQEVGLMKAADPAPYHTVGFCTAADIEGDYLTFSYHAAGLEGGTWTTGNGTGKYEGLSGSGTSAFQAPLHEGFIVSFKGKQTFE